MSVVSFFSRRPGPIVLSILVLASLLPIPPGAQATDWTLQGRVYEGTVGDETSPLPGVTVSVYGAYNAYPDLGAFIRSTTTDSSGWYGLIVYDDDGPYEFYHLLEFDPSGYSSEGATTVGGTVREANWIE